MIKNEEVETMLKKLIVLGIVIILIFSLFSLTACGNGEDKEVAELIKQIRQTYWESIEAGLEMQSWLEGSEIDFDDVYVKHFWGVYNGSAVVIMNIKEVDWPRVSEFINVAGFEFDWTVGLPIRVWRDNKFYNLQEAFENDFLTVENIGEIHELWSAIC